MNELDAHEQLAYIRNIMEETRRTITIDGVDLMRWGILTIIGLLVTYWQVLMRFSERWIWVVWVVVVGLGWALSIRTYMRTRTTKATTFPGKLAWRIWGGYGVAATILGFVGPMSGAYSPDYIVAVLAALIGAAYYGSSLIFEKSWLRISAVGWWCGSVVMFLFPVIHMLLLFGLMMFVFQVIPGYKLYRVQKMKLRVQE